MRNLESSYRIVQQIQRGLYHDIFETASQSAAFYESETYSTPHYIYTFDKG